MFIKDVKLNNKFSVGFSEEERECGPTFKLSSPNDFSSNIIV